MPGTRDEISLTAPFNQECRSLTLYTEVVNTGKGQKVTLWPGVPLPASCFRFLNGTTQARHAPLQTPFGAVILHELCAGKNSGRPATGFSALKFLKILHSASKNCFGGPPPGGLIHPFGYFVSAG